MGLIEEIYLGGVVLAFVVFATFVIRANNASVNYRKNH
jgi:hypothetical protein